MKLKNIKGFTLIELMVVVVIIGILAAMALPKFLTASVKSKAAEAPSLLTEYETLQLTYAQNGGSCGTAAQIGWTLPGTAGVTKFFTYADGGVAGTGANATGQATPLKQYGSVYPADVFQSVVI